MKTFISLQKLKKAQQNKSRQLGIGLNGKMKVRSLKEVLKVEIPNCCLRQSHLINVKTKKVLVVFKSKG
jgi:hypothetical protein